MFGALGGLLHAVATVTFAVNHIVSGVAITLLGLGVTKYLASLVFLPVTQNPRESPRVPGFAEFSIPGLSDGARGAGGPAARGASRTSRACSAGWSRT